MYNSNILSNSIYIMSEHYINAVEDYLSEGLSFKMPPGGSYVISRKIAHFIPQGQQFIAHQTEPN